jgi:hypothetical protein
MRRFWNDLGRFDCCWRPVVLKANGADNQLHPVKKNKKIQIGSDCFLNCGEWRAKIIKRF